MLIHFGWKLIEVDWVCDKIRMLCFDEKSEEENNGSISAMQCCLAHLTLPPYIHTNLIPSLINWQNIEWFFIESIEKVGCIILRFLKFWISFKAFIRAEWSECAPKCYLLYLLWRAKLTNIINIEHRFDCILFIKSAIFSIIFTIGGILIQIVIYSVCDECEKRRRRSKTGKKINMEHPIIDIDRWNFLLSFSWKVEVSQFFPLERFSWKWWSVKMLSFARAHGDAVCW